MLKPKIDKWTEFLKYSQKHNPLIVDCQALCIFSRDYEGTNDPYRLLALAGKYLIFYEISEFMAIYPDAELDNIPMLKNYIYMMNAFFESEERKRLFDSQDPEKPLTEEDVKAVLKVLKNYSPINRNIDPRVCLIHDYVRKAGSLVDLPPEKLWPELYRLNNDWLLDATVNLSLISFDSVQKLIESYLSNQIARSVKYQQQSHNWGREFDEYFTELKALEYSDKTAKTLARKRFIAAHPIYEESSSGREPGYAMETLHRYHQMFLKSKNSG
jgi:hypothetical protein